MSSPICLGMTRPEDAAADKAADRSVLLIGEWSRWAPLERDRWHEWLRRHSIDPRSVVMGFPISCDDTSRTVSFYSAPQHGFAWTRRTVQMEAPALPFPTVTRDEIRGWPQRALLVKRAA